MAKKSNKTFRPRFETLEDRSMCAVTAHGGVVIPHVQAENLYLGSAWESQGGVASAQYLQGFTSMYVNSPAMDAMTNAGYGVARGTAVAGHILPYSMGNSVSDGQIEWGIEQAIHAGQAMQPGASGLYVVFVAPNVNVILPSGGSSAHGNFTGYHSAFAGTDAYGHRETIHYAVIAYPGGINPSPSLYGYPSIGAEITDTASHEIAEAVTDPNLNAWYDNSRGEIGDITNRWHQYLDGYYVQLLANKADQPMRVTNGTVYYDNQPWHPGVSGADSHVVGTESNTAASDSQAAKATDAVFASFDESLDNYHKLSALMGSLRK